MEDDNLSLAHPLKTRGDMHKMIRALQELKSARCYHGMDWYRPDRSGCYGETDFEDYATHGYDLCTDDVIEYLTESR